MLGNDAMEFLKTLHKLDNIWNEVEDAEYNDRQLTQFAERYHEHKLKLLGIADVVGQSEQLPCQHCGQLEPCAGNSPETCYHPKVC